MVLGQLSKHMQNITPKAQTTREKKQKKNFCASKDSQGTSLAATKWRGNQIFSTPFLDHVDFHNHQHNKSKMRGSAGLQLLIWDSGSNKNHINNNSSSYVWDALLNALHMLTLSCLLEQVLLLQTREHRVRVISSEMADGRPPEKREASS